MGWINYIKWLIITIIPVFIITIVVIHVTSYFSIIIQLPLEYFLVALIAAPLFMYLTRSFSLFYMSGGLGYLECQNCGGYYELQPGESPEDFDKCECGEKLKYTKSIPGINQSEDLVSDNAENLDKNLKTKQTSTNKKRNLIIIGILTLIIIAIPIIYSSHALTQTPTNYKLLGSYNVSNLGDNGKGVNLPQGTRNIK